MTFFFLNKNYENFLLYFYDPCKKTFGEKVGPTTEMLLNFQILLRLEFGEEKIMY